MFAIIKGRYINTQNITYITVNDNELTINFAGGSDNYIRLEFKHVHEAKKIAERLSDGHNGNLL